MRHELAALQRATHGICRKTDQVMLCKAEVFKALDELEGQLMLPQDLKAQWNSIAVSSLALLY